MKSIGNLGCRASLRSRKRDHDENEIIDDDDSFVLLVVVVV